MHTSLQRQQEIKIDIVNKELSNNAWYDTGECMDTEFEWQKIKADKKMTRLFSIEFNVLHFSTPFFLFFFLPNFSRALNVVRVVEGKWYRNDLKGSKNYFELREVRVIWSQLYSIQSEDYMSDADIFLELILLCW